MAPTKLVPPAEPAGFVPRPRLHALLAEATRQRVTVVSAHAGTGKSVLLGSYCRTLDPARVAWVGLDREDDWAPRLWSLVDAALRGPAGGRRRAPLGDDPVAGILSRLPADGEPLLLVLDDVHELRSTAVLEQLASLLAHAPDGLRVVLAARADPGLRLQRLRLAGDLAEIRAADLAFTAPECASLLATTGVHLDDDALEELARRTEGWAAGVRLAALSLRGEPDPAHLVRRFAGDDAAVMDYLLSEILDRQPPDLVDFLLRTSVPDMVTPELADELTGRTDGGRVLARLQAENFLVSRPADDGPAFRYHTLLREFLRAQLEYAHRDALPGLHGTSARWHRDHGWPATAFEHALQAGDWELAEEIYGEAWHLLRVVATTLPADRLPTEAVESCPALALRAADLAAASGTASEAERLVARAEALLSAEDAADDDPRRELAAVTRLECAGRRGDHAEVLALAPGLLALPAVMADDPSRARVVQALALAHLGGAQAALGRFDEAETSLRLALSAALETHLDAVVLQARSGLAVLDAARGRLRSAALAASSAVDFAASRGWEARPDTAAAETALAWARYQWDELEEAATHAAAATRTATGPAHAAGDALAALVHAALGDADAALARAHAARAAASVGPHPLLTSVLPTLEARVLLAAGDPLRARAALADADPDDPDVALVRARLLLAGGRPADALRVLETVEPAGCSRAQELELLVLDAVAHHTTHDEAASAQTLGRALALGQTDSYRRPFVDAGPVIREMLVREVRRGTAHRAYVAELLAALDRRAARVEITRPELLEPLSDRERAVLRYLPTMMTNSEIAAELFLSVNTVKTHLRSIYRKLGTTRRRDAVECARRLGIL